MAFENFAHRFKLSVQWPIEEALMPHFVADQSLLGKSHATVKSYLAGIAAKHRINGWPDPTKSFLVTKLLKGLSRTAPTKESRKPITFEKLQSILSCLSLVCKNTFEAVLFKTMFSIAFFGFFRVSELLGQSPSLLGGRKGVQREDVKLLLPRAMISLSGSKTDQDGKGQLIVLVNIPSLPDVCPVMLLSKFLEMSPGTAGSLFIHLDGSPVTRYQFQSVLKKAADFLGWQTSGFSSHSFRIGAATTAAANGMKPDKLMKMGRWKSSAYKSYIRPNLV